MSDFDDDEWLLKQIKSHRNQSFPLIAMAIVTFGMMVVRDPDLLDKIIGSFITLTCGFLSWFVWRDPEGLIPMLERRINERAERKAQWAADNASDSHEEKSRDDKESE